MTRLAWLTEPRLSPLYALAAAAAGRRLVNERLQMAAGEACRSLARDTPEISTPLWQELARMANAAAGRGDGGERVAGFDLSINSFGSVALADPAAGLAASAEFAEFARVFADCLPRSASELPLRTRPFLELWEARGPGLLRQLFQLLDEAWGVPSNDLLNESSDGALDDHGDEGRSAIEDGVEGGSEAECDEDDAVGVVDGEFTTGTDASREAAREIADEAAGEAAGEAARATRRGIERVERDCLVSWVYPATGGGGWSEAGSGVVFFEAVLTNAFEPLSELLRLAWHVAHATLPAGWQRRASSGAAVGANGERGPVGGGISTAAALIPFVLAAGEHVELAVADERHVALALQAWMGWERSQALELAQALTAQ